MGAGCIDLTSKSSFCEPMGATSRGPERRPSPVNARTPPNCARCRNHDQIFPLKGHKRYCKRLNCNCEKCQLTAERQKVMARQTAIRRAEEQDRQRMRNGLPVPATNDSDADGGPGGPRSPGEADDSLSSSGGLAGGSGVPASPPRQQPPSVPVPVRPVPHQPQNINVNSNEEVWRSILTLLNDYQLPINTTPFLHIILNRVTPNTEEVYKLYLRAQEELKKTGPMREEARRPASSPHPQPIHPLLAYQAYPTAAPLYHHRQAAHYVPPPFMAAHTARFNPYQLPVPLLRHSSFRTSDYIDYTLHESSRPGMLLPAECHLMYRPDELELKPASPSNSDKSSFSGSVDIS